MKVLKSNYKKKRTVYIYTYRQETQFLIFAKMSRELKSWRVTSRISIIVSDLADDKSIQHAPASEALLSRSRSLDL